MIHGGTSSAGGAPQAHSRRHEGLGTASPRGHQVQPDEQLAWAPGSSPRVQIPNLVVQRSGTSPDLADPSSLNKPRFGANAGRLAQQGDPHITCGCETANQWLIAPAQPVDEASPTLRAGSMATAAPHLSEQNRSLPSGRHAK